MFTSNILVFYHRNIYFKIVGLFLDLLLDFRVMFCVLIQEKT